MGRALLVLLLLALPGLSAASAGATEERLVSFEAGTPPAGALVGGARVVEAFPFAGVALVEGSAADLARLARLPGVAGVYAVEPLSFQIDRARAIVQADAPEGVAWPRGANVTVALVDSGLDGEHPDFEGRILANVRVTRSGGVAAGTGDDDGHGTHVAGILGGSGAMSEGASLRGLAPEARLVGVDISDAFTTTSAVRAFAWLHEHREQYGIRVVSNSWGREKEDARYDPDDPVIRATDALVSDGLVVVFSAGNRGRDGASTLTPEAMNPNVITVGSASPHGRAESYSARGPALDTAGEPVAWTKPDIMAPGSGILSTRSSAVAPSGSTGSVRYYTVMNGTSMAAPQVAAAAALLLDAHPELSAQMVAAILQGTARDLAAAGPDAQTGFGMLDVQGALAAARALTQGEERIVVETRVPVRLEGSLAAASGSVLLDRGDLQAPPATEVVLPLVVPEGAIALDLHFNWSGPGAFRVRLEGPGSSRAFEPAGASTLSLVGEAVPGAHRIVVRPDGPVSYATFTIGGGVTVREERIVEVPTEFAARPFTAQGGFYLPETGAERALAVVSRSPWLALALCGGIAAVAGLAWRRRVSRGA